MRAVIVLVADEKYLPHAKALMVNCIRQGEWDGEFCLILPPDCDKAYFESRGISVLTDPEPSYFRKFAIFDPFFFQQETTIYETLQNRWDIALYLDADVLIQAPLEPVFHEYESGTVLAVREPFDLMHAFTFWASPESLKSPETLDLFRWLWKRYDPTWKEYNTGILLYQLQSLPPNLRQELQLMRGRIAPVNSHVVNGTDQPVINLVLQEHFRTVRSSIFSYWYEAGPETRVVHYNSGYAPWVEKEASQNAYFNAKLGRACHALYLENLAAFDSTFPVRTPTP